eukprot:gene15121-10823_t
MDVLTSQLDSLRLLLEEEEEEPQWQWHSDRLNAEQRLAVRQMTMPLPMPQGESPRPFVLFGPLGTGKTSTLVAWSLGNEADLFRLHAYSRRVEDVDPFSVRRYTGSGSGSSSGSSSVDDTGHFVMPPIADLQRFRVVVTTCATAAKLFYLGMSSAHFIPRPRTEGSTAQMISKDYSAYKALYEFSPVKPQYLQEAPNAKSQKHHYEYPSADDTVFGLGGGYGL